MSTASARYHCLRCDAPVSADLSPIPAGIVDVLDDREPVPPGFWCTDARKHRFVLHPDDWWESEEAREGRGGGCCDGWFGRALCENGHPVGEFADHCWEAWLRLDIERVRLDPVNTPSRQAGIFGVEPCKTVWDVADALHEALGLPGWIGPEWDEIVRAYRAQSPAEVTLLWLHTAASSAAGVPVDSIRGSLQAAGFRVFTRPGGHWKPVASSTTHR